MRIIDHVIWFCFGIVGSLISFVGCFSYFSGYSLYHILLLSVIWVISHFEQNEEHQCYSPFDGSNETLISCNHLAFMKLISFEKRPLLEQVTELNPDIIVRHTREELDSFWKKYFYHPIKQNINLNIETKQDIIYNKEFGVAYRTLWYNMNNDKSINEMNLQSNGVIVAIHGGAYIAGNIKQQEIYLSYLGYEIGKLFNNKNNEGKRKEMKGIPHILAVDYRLAPECPIPCAIDDIYWIVKQYLHNEIGISMNKISLIGDSAGGSIASLVMQKIANENGFDKYKNVGSAVLISPGFDWSFSGESWQRNKKLDTIIFYENMLLVRKYAFGFYQIDSQFVRIRHSNDNDNNNNNKNDMSYDDDMNDDMNDDMSDDMNDENICTSDGDVCLDEMEWDSPDISALFGNFQGLPKMMISTSQYESLYSEDTLFYQKAKQYNNDTILHINYGSSLHTLACFADLIPEAYDNIRKFASFFFNHYQTID